MIALDEFAALGSRLWWLCFSLLLAGRSMDLLSTWLATPNLALEANPIARRLGWRFGLPLNLILALAFATWPLLAISFTTTSLLVAARNLQHAWLMRALGEGNYRVWISSCVSNVPRSLVFFCQAGEALLTGLIGLALLWFGRERLTPFAIGLGILAYAVAVAVFTTLALWRMRR